MQADFLVGAGLPAMQATRCIKSTSADVIAAVRRSGKPVPTFDRDWLPKSGRLPGRLALLVILCRSLCGACHRCFASAGHFFVFVMTKPAQVGSFTHKDLKCLSTRSLEQNRLVCGRLVSPSAPSWALFFSRAVPPVQPPPRAVNAKITWTCASSAALANHPYAKTAGNPSLKGNRE
ncbi:hypothetical protein SAMN04515675_1620 [Pseudomonas costantinii]|uniref:Uncharacterized protein n=1 Tax=Pseudomonas costantinii TaxID=168469 RepID=A0A1H5BSX6_9PSED|nr:hypothetical protein SAMN04515675_1620 [Pseudomonas costantinii]